VYALRKTSNIYSEDEINRGYGHAKISDWYWFEVAYGRMIMTNVWAKGLNIIKLSNSMADG